MAVLAIPGRSSGGGPGPYGPQVDQPRVDTRIAAAYREEGRRLDGSVTQVWTNTTQDTVPDLWFHLYWNAFSNNQSTFLSESGGKLRSHSVTPGTEQDSEWGWQRVTSVVVAGEERIASLRYRQPDSGSSLDKSVFSIELAHPLAPGQTVEVSVRWESRVPRLRRRTGYKDDFLLIAQWFPKLGVYQSGRGWNCHEFHERSEFFGNWGTYDVELDLPAAYEGHVFASGVPLSPSERQGERVIARFQAPSASDRAHADAQGHTPLVHDFAWTADPDVKPRRATFHFDEWRQRFPDEVARVQNALGKERDISLSDVEVWVLMQPEHEVLWKRHYEATCTALFFYGLWFGEYPYERVTLVDPPWGGGQAGGMEYPTLFTCGSSLFVPEDSQTFENVAVHECGHQFVYGVIANNEFEEAWLDEGFNSWADSEALLRRYGPRMANTEYSGLHYPGVTIFPIGGGGALGDMIAGRALDVPFTGFKFQPLRASGFVDYWRDQPSLAFVSSYADQRWADRSDYLRDPAGDPLSASWRYKNGETYKIGAYVKPAVVLRSLPAVLGPDGDARLLRGMRRYADALRFRHASTVDFVREFNAGAGEDVSWYFDETFGGTGTVDWKIEVSEQRVADPMGFAQDDVGGPFEFQDRLEKREPQSEPENRLDILVSRTGELCLPVDVRWTFEDKTSETVRWTRDEQQKSRWKRFTRISTKKCVSAAIDPDHGYFLDLNMRDNQWFKAKDIVAPWRWTERAFSRASHWLFFQGGLGG
ncbi:MAG TPA: M1 family metallopeptidase [Planctomycetota bacterium]|nr:M1 family metallopeptidase [Planctomycetota bacterium]